MIPSLCGLNSPVSMSKSMTWSQVGSSRTGSTPDVLPPVGMAGSLGVVKQDAGMLGSIDWL